MTIFNLILAAAELLLAVLLWHRAIPALYRQSLWRAREAWLLGMALVIFGTGQMEAALGFATISPLRCCGDLFLIAYAGMRYREIVRHLPPPHWSELL